MLNPISIEEKMSEWKADHAKMMEETIHEEHKPNFDDLMNDLSMHLQAVAWRFELSFAITST